MITQAKWKTYFALREQGHSQKSAAQTVGISASSGYARERRLRNNSGKQTKIVKLDSGLPEPKTREQLGPEAARALDDFGYFRRRYFGRVSTPWQEDAGYKVAQLEATPRKEYVVINCPPGSGKSTLFTLDIAAWLTCRNRGIRGMIGSASATLAERYVTNLRNVLESPYRFQAEPDLIEMGLAVDAEATLSEDFGFFKPNPTVVWSNKAFTVAQLGLRQVSHKEPTWSAYGLESTLIGGRYDVAFWDDIIDDADVRTLERIEWHRDRWDKVHEKRLEPGGVLVMPGQRLSPEDIYGYCRDKPAGESIASDHGECCDAVPGMKYHHIVYRAHFEDRCGGDHGEDGPAAYFLPPSYKPAERKLLEVLGMPVRSGCLLDPLRLPWGELEAEMANSLSNFLQVYQQEDTDPSQVLVHPLWVRGGTDPHTGETFLGCWDNDRDLCELPPGIDGPVISVASTDPSPTRMWASEWWCYSPKLELRWLLDLERAKMQIGDFLTEEHGVYSGLMEEWWQRSKDAGQPITHWIIEANAAQRFITQVPYVRRWAANRGVILMEHQTNRNKSDPKYGPTLLSNLYRFGRVRLPGKQLTQARITSLKLVDEVTKWPKGAYDDCVMAEWFFEYALPNLIPSKKAAGRGARRPSWAKMRERLTA